MRSILLSLGCVLCSCRDPKASGPAAGSSPLSHPGVIAQVGDSVITEQMFRAEWARRHNTHSAQSAPSDQERAAVLEDLIRQETLWARAKAEGFDRSPEIQARIKNLVTGAYRESRSKAPTGEVAEADLQAQYEAQKKRWMRPAAVRGAAILLAVPRTASPAKRAGIKAKAEALAQTALTADEPAFTDLARQHSDDQSTRFRGGDLGWLTRESVGRETGLFDALTALPKPGPLPHVVETPVGYQVARLLERREAGPRPYDEVREALRHQSQAARRVQAEEEFQQSLRRGLAIEVDRSRLAAMDLTASPITPPALPGGVAAQTSP